MFKKIFLVFLLPIAMLTAEDYLMAIELNHDRLAPLLNKGLSVVKELDSSAIVTVEHSDLYRLVSFQYRILDVNPVEGDYYLVFFGDEQIDLKEFGDILLQDGSVCLLKIRTDMLEALTRKRVELMRLRLKPIRKVEQSITPRFFVNPVVQQIVDLVEADTVLSFVQRMQDFRTRYSTHDSCDAAANWVASKFNDYGCDSVFFQYHTGGHAPNVIGVKWGVVYPDSIYAVIDGHLDATSNQAPNIAPGADDNASGTAAAIEAARVMKDFLFEHSVRYIAFTGEEFGLYGSDYYAVQARANDDSILGVLNGDMIGYVDALPESVEVLANSTNSAFADFFIACADTYTTLLTDKHIVASIPSDIQPFYDRGYPGICTIEDYWPTNPYYHLTGDTIGAGFNNIAFCTEVTRAEIAALSILAKPYGAAGMPEIPTIVKPLDYGRMPDLQPTLTFYSTDSEDDDIRYRILWDSDPDFGSPDSGTTPTYPSGTIVDYTIPIPLADGITYWWKVKASDPAGSGFWTLYASQRSFTIGTSLPPVTCSWYQTTAAQWSADVFDGTRVEGDSVVLGGVTAYDTLLQEDFESGIPGSWTVIDGNGDGYQWQSGTTGDLGSYTPPDYGSAYAFYSDDDAGSGIINYNEELISPAVYTAGYNVLELVYGYGFRVYQSGEKYRVKMRTFTGSWSGWSDLVVYITSSSGTEAIDISAYLPADSVQFDWFYSDSTSSSHYGWACGCDNVVVRRGYLVPFDSGTVTGTEVKFNELSTTRPRTTWGDIVWTKATVGDSVGFQVEYFNSTWQLVPDAELPGNSSGFFSDQVSDTVSINTLDTLTYGTLRLIGLLVRDITDTPEYPALKNWEVGNLANYIGIAENGGAKAISGSVFSVHPNITKSGLNIAFAVANPNGPVELGVYDVSGRRVKDLIHNFKVNPVNEIYWNGFDNLGRKVAAGVYFIRFKTGTYEKVEKAILVR